MVFSIVFGGSLWAAQPAFAQNAPLKKEIPPEKLEALVSASAELDAFFAAHHRKLERAKPEDLGRLQEQLLTEPKAILHRYNLNSDDLALWRKQLEAYGDTPTQALEDPHFYGVVNRLLPKK